ncbi:MAG TPA: PhzF family phenazine biosynthesis isomerase [Burkholderiales bacterium]|jgi:PhzF family phenazine biosynthesis protein
MSRSHAAHLVKVFPAGENGGNRAPIVLDAQGMSDEAMRGVARAYGHESGFVLPPAAGSGADFRMRYFVPQHEMEMCGHATVGALWLLRKTGRWTSTAAIVQTPLGPVRGHVRNAGSADEFVEITQPAGKLQAIEDAAHLAAIARVLRVAPGEIAPLPVYNAATSRIKTLIALRSVAALDALAPDFSAVEALCEAIGSTGLYPFAVESREQRIFHARQFPKSSGYPEDAATGIAAAALLFGLASYGLVPVDGDNVTINQGRAMGAPSAIRLRVELDAAGKAIGCFLGGAVSD